MNGRRLYRFDHFLNFSFIRRVSITNHSRTMIHTKPLPKASKLNETITKLSVEVHILNTSLTVGESPDVLITDCLERILSLVVMIKDPYDRIQQHVSDFDCCHHNQHNGFRSLCYLAEQSIDLTTSTITKYKRRKKTFFFNKLIYEQKFQNIRDLLCTIYFMLKLGEKILLNKLENSSSENQSRSLFVNIDDPINKIMYETELFIDKVFYGNLLGFYFKDSMRLPMNNVANAMAGFADALDKTSNKFGRAVTTIAFSSMYSNNREKRSERLKSLLSSPSLEFIKSFWSISEDYNLTVFTDLMGPFLAIDNSFKIPTCTDIHLPKSSSTNSAELDVSSSTFVLKSLPNKSYLNARLYCSKLREGHKTFRDKTALDILFPQELEPNCDHILFHCPGGGFLAQSPKSHGIYLKNWAKKINVPIVSIDYSKAPQSPFPSAVDECFYAYCWMLRHHNMLGSSAKKIGIVGDSAGGNLIYGVVNKAIEAGIRVPDFIVAVYPVLSLQPTITPSRILSICDILLSAEVLKLCLSSYISENEVELKNCTPLFTDSNEIDPDTFLSKTIEPNIHNISAVLSSSCLEKMSTLSLDDNDFYMVGDLGNEKVKNKTKKLRKSPSDDTLDLKKEQSTSKRIRKYHDRLKQKQLKSGEITNILFCSSNDCNISGENASKNEKSSNNQATSHSEMLLLQQQCGWTDMKKRTCRHHHISPLFTPDHLIKKFPMSYLIVSNVDPLLDDSVEFCKKLKENEAPFELSVVEGLPHGFVQFSMVSNDASNANDVIINWMLTEFNRGNS